MHKGEEKKKYEALMKYVARQQQKKKKIKRSKAEKTGAHSNMKRERKKNTSE